MLAQEPDWDLAGIVDPAALGPALARDLGVPCFASLDALLAAVHVDALIVATPNRTHEAVGAAAAARGLHLLVEKPIAHDLASARRLVAAAEQAGVHLLVGHHRRYNPAVERARALLNLGAVGRLVAVSAHWMLRKPDAYFADDWRRQPGGGPVLINLIHDIDLLRHLCGEIVEVSARTSNAMRGFAVEDTAAILLTFETGALATILVSDAAPSPWNWESASADNPNIPAGGQNCIRFFGSEAALEFPNLTLWRHDGASPGDWTLPLTAAPLETPGADPHTESLVGQLRHFARVIRGQEPARITGPDATRTLAATLAVLAGGTGQPPGP